LDLLQAILEFFKIILSSWQGYLTGGVFVAIVSVWEHYSGHSISWSKYKWGVIAFLFISVFLAWYDQRTTIINERQISENKKTEYVSKIEALKTKYDDIWNNIKTSSPAFYNGREILRAFMSYRRTIGPDAKCMTLVTSTEDSANLAGTVIAFSVPGSNCPNGDLQNIGVKPEDVDKESLNGMIPGKIVLHALPDTKGADRLVDDLGNLIQTTRSYEMPRPVKPSENIIWLQFGAGTKWNSQLH